MGAVYLIGSNAAGTFMPWFSDTNATVELWGAGGAGINEGTGGVGAGYSKDTGVTLTSGTPVAFSLGTPGSASGVAGGDTWWVSAANQIANGGGSATTRIGGTTQAGGAGGTTSNKNPGGGGAGGPNGAGNHGGTGGSTGGAGGSGCGGGTVGGSGGTSTGTGGNGFLGTGGAAGTNGTTGTVGLPGGLGAGGGGGGQSTSGVGAAGGCGGDDYDNGGGGGGGGGAGSSTDGAGGHGGTPGGGSGSGSRWLGGYAEIKITTSQVSGNVFLTYPPFTSAMINPSWLTPFTPPNVAAPYAWNGNTIHYVPAQSGNAVQGAATLVSGITVTVGTAVSSGNTVCIMAGSSPQFGADSNFQITDNVGGNTYTPVVLAIDGGGAAYTAFYCVGVTGSPTQFTLSDSGGQQMGWCAMSVDTFSGVHSVDTSATNTQDGPGTGTDVITTGNFTPAEAGEAIWCGMISWAATNAAGTNYTAAQHNDSTFLCIDSEYRLAAPSGAQPATFTNATNGGTSGDYFDTAAILLKP